MLRPAVLRTIPGWRILQPDVIDRHRIVGSIERADRHIDLARSCRAAVRQRAAASAAELPNDARCRLEGDRRVAGELEIHAADGEPAHAVRTRCAAAGRAVTQRRRIEQRAAAILDAAAQAAAGQGVAHERHGAAALGVDTPDVPIELSGCARDLVMIPPILRGAAATPA